MVLGSVRLSAAKLVREICGTRGRSIADEHRQGNVNAVPDESVLVTSMRTDFVAPPEVAARMYLPVGTALSAASVKLAAFAT